MLKKRTMLTHEPSFIMDVHGLELSCIQHRGRCVRDVFRVFLCFVSCTVVVCFKRVVARC